ncbi:MAG TPA: dihydrolipoamide acetyltransferase family protein [Nitrospiria bacterium]|nr:dihydrolipoamide acetyltransferase family protein [Nitrospiria bacterium]
MRKEFKFPDVGEGIVEGEIVRWLVAEGESVKEDQPLVEVETDKAVVTLPSPFSGKVVKCHVKEGGLIHVGETLVTYGNGEGTASPHKEKKKDSASVVGRLPESEDEEETVVRAAGTVGKGVTPLRAIPSVRALAKELGVDLSRVKGTGPEGRITRRDVERAAEKIVPKSAPVTKIVPESLSYGPIERVPLRGLRRSSARHVAQSAARVAAVTFMNEADITDLEKVRFKEKKVAEAKGYKLTYLPFIMRGVIAGLKAYPYLNATLDEESEEIILKKYYNIGIAVDTADGLMVFVIKQADQKSILDLAEEISTMIEKAERRKIDLSELKGGSFTITNYGVIGGTYGTPIINYPEVAILGVGKVLEKPVIKEGAIVARKMLPLSLTFDHRVINGAEAARFMNEVVRHIEDPDLMLIEGK